MNFLPTLSMTIQGYVWRQILKFYLYRYRNQAELYLYGTKKDLMAFYRMKEIDKG